MSPISKKSRPQKRRKTTNYSRPQVVFVSEEFCQKVGVDAFSSSKNSHVDKTNPILETFFRQQKEERQNELDTLATRDLIQRDALSNLSRVLRRRLEEAVSEYSEEILQSSRAASQRSSIEASDAEEQENNINSVPRSHNAVLLDGNSEDVIEATVHNDERSSSQESEPVSVWDSFFERQRLERRNEVDTLSSVNHITRERTFLISSMLSERITTAIDRDSTPARDELSSLRESHQVRNLLADSFRQRLERLLSNRNNRTSNQGGNVARGQRASLNRRNASSSSGTSSPRNGPPIPVPPPPPIPAARRLAVAVPHPRRHVPAELPPPPPEPAAPVGWANFRQEHNTQQRNIIRSDRFDDLAEIGNLVGNQVVSRVLNSTFADILEQHLIHRMESSPDTFSQEARREVQRTLDSLPRSRIVRNDFRDVGIDPYGLPRLLENPVDNPFDEPAAVPVPHLPTRPRRPATGAQMGDDRLLRLETMMEAMQNMMTRQNTAQTQLENTLQQMVLNQSLMTASSSSNLHMVSERAGTCVVCLDETQVVNSAFYKCGHMVACNHCASILLAINPTCPLCRQPILDVINLYRVENSSNH